MITRIRRFLDRTAAAVTCWLMGGHYQCPVPYCDKEPHCAICHKPMEVKK